MNRKLIKIVDLFWDHVPEAMPQNNCISLRVIKIILTILREFVRVRTFWKLYL